VTTPAPSIPDRVCIVGAGPSGLVVARQLRAAGVPFDLFEKHSGPGGIWDPANVGTPIYRSAHFISSRYSSGFYAHPMPESFPDYPSWRDLLSYITQFAVDEGLDDLVTYNSTVERAHLEEDGTWSVTVNGRRRRYRALVAAPGVTWHPNIPELAGQESFTGEIRHSSTYSDPSEFSGKQVVVIGAGNSGVDIACDAAANADATIISLRRGYRFLPKHVFGVPLDMFMNYGGEPPAGVTLPADPNELVDAIVGDLTRLGLPKPDHQVLESHPIVNDQILHHLRHGDIAAKPDVECLDGDEVVFVDGSREKADLVLLATGYEYRLPFLDPELLEWNQGHPQLYLNIFSRTVDSLYVVGFIEFADAAYKRFEEMAQLVAMDLTLSGEYKAAFREMKRSHRPDLRGGQHYIESPRHANYVETHTYQHVLADVREQFGLPSLTDVYGDEQVAA
jgi:hypothetical protein